MKLCVLWYFRYPLSYRNVAEMMAIRGITVSHQSVFRWVGKLGKEFGEKVRNLHGEKRTVSWYVDETYVKVFVSIPGLDQKDVFSGHARYFSCRLVVLQESLKTNLTN